MALLMLPRVVLTHLRAGFRAALRPDPVMIGWWTQPALPTPAKQCRPSLTTVLAGWKLRCATSSGLACPLVWFDRRHDRRLARRTAAPLAAVALPAEIGVVDLDPSRQALCGVPLHHRLHELVLDLPGGGLGDAKPAAQLHAGDAALALSEVIHGAKPRAQRQLGCRENRSGDHGCLPSTGGTLVKRCRVAWVVSAVTGASSLLCTPGDISILRRQVPYIPTGLWKSGTAYRKNLKGPVLGPGIFQWGVDKV